MKDFKMEELFDLTLYVYGDYRKGFVQILQDKKSTGKRVKPHFVILQVSNRTLTWNGGLEKLHNDDDLDTDTREKFFKLSKDLSYTYTYKRGDRLAFTTLSVKDLKEEKIGDDTQYRAVLTNKRGSVTLVLCILEEYVYV